MSSALVIVCMIHTNEALNGNLSVHMKQDWHDLARRWLPYAAIDVHPESMPVQAPAPAPVRLQREDFAPGDSVSFEGRDLIRKFGTIRRINQKTASIACEDGLEWRVSFGLLQRVIPVN